MQKWEVVRVFCTHLRQPHDKFCLCICPVRHLFYFVNSDPPQFRRAREHAISIENFEAHFLTHKSFIDTTTLEELDPAVVVAAYADPDRRHGRIAPFLVTRLRGAVEGHNVLTDWQKQLVLDE